MSRSNEKPYKIVAKEGTYETLKFLNIHGKSSLEELLIYMERSEFSVDEIKERIVELEGIGFIARSPSKRKSRLSYNLTREGKEAILLVDIVNGDPLSLILERIPSLQASSFTLITHDITNYFIDDLAHHRDFSEVFVCSPWIRLSPVVLNDIDYLLESARKLTELSPKLHVITRPVFETPKDTIERSWHRQICDTLRWFKKRGAEIICIPNLHTKLFIVFGKEFQTAIFGSENLTGAQNVELGIWVNDPVIVDKLYIYWEEIYNDSGRIELEEENLIEKQES